MFIETKPTTMSPERSDGVASLGNLKKKRIRKRRVSMNISFLRSEEAVSEGAVARFIEIVMPSLTVGLLPRHDTQP
jgi:hypothetical protein